MRFRDRRETRENRGVSRDVLDLPSLTILPGIVATIRDEKLRFRRIHLPRDISRDFDEGTTFEEIRPDALSFSLSDPQESCVALTRRPRADDTFFLVKYDGLVRFLGTISRTLARRLDRGDDGYDATKFAITNAPGRARPRTSNNDDEDDDRPRRR